MAEKSSKTSRGAGNKGKHSCVFPGKYCGVSPALPERLATIHTAEKCTADGQDIIKMMKDQACPLKATKVTAVTCHRQKTNTTDGSSLTSFHH